MLSKFLRCFGVVVLLAFVFSSCTKDQSSGLNRNLPSSFGGVSDLNVIADSSMWNSDLGDSLRAYFERYYPILPQREAFYNVRFFTPEALYDKPIRKELSNFLVLIDHSAADSKTLKLFQSDLKKINLDTMRLIKGRNKWARDQLLLFLNGRDEDQLMSQLRKYKEIIAREVDRHEVPLLSKELYSQGNSNLLEKLILDSFQVELKIPAYYRDAIHEKGFLWLRGDSEKINRNIMITKIPYSSESQLTKAFIKELRDTLGAEFISTTIEGSYMRINDVDLPLITESKKINGQYALEALGIWEIYNDFLGGPFASYIIMYPDRKNLLFIDFFVHAPSKEKRNLMKELKHILHSLRFEG